MAAGDGGGPEGNARGPGSNASMGFPPSFTDLRAESRRLHFEFLRNTIDLSLTVAEFASANLQSQSQRSASLRAAQKGYEVVLQMLAKPSSTQENIAELNSKLNELRQAIGDPASVTAGSVPDEPKAPKPADLPERAAASPVEPLTAREMEVLRCVAGGHSTKETAHLLGMSFKTAACHRYRLMDKLAIHDLASLVRYAIRKGLVRP